MNDLTEVLADNDIKRKENEGYTKKKCASSVCSGLEAVHDILKENESNDERLYQAAIEFPMEGLSGVRQPSFSIAKTLALDNYQSIPITITRKHAFLFVFFRANTPHMYFV